ncbi:MAG: family 10 glycosylhydrolase [Firmicutes bacterium]|nr:family 10 glycosylhydrolase [Bacillota bacterium]
MLKKTRAFMFFILLSLYMTINALATPVYLYQTTENWLSLSSVKTFLDLILTDNKIIKDLTLLQSSSDHSSSALIIPLSGKLTSNEITQILEYAETGKLIFYPLSAQANESNQEFFSRLIDSSPVKTSTVRLLDGTDSTISYTEFKSGCFFHENIVSSINTDATRKLFVTLLREINPSFLEKTDRTIHERVLEIETLIQNTLLHTSIPEKATANDLATGLTALLSKAKTIESSGSGKIWSLNSLKLEVENQIELYKASSFESMPVETRGIWISSKAIPKTEPGIKEMVRMIKDAGFNVILPEVFFHGYTIYPSLVAKEYGIDHQSPNFLNFDPLQILVEEANKNNIEIHPWFSVFYVGLNSYGPILSKYPDWIAVNKDGSFGYKRDGNHLYFASPLNLDFRDYVTNLMQEVAKYGVDGIHLDYVRYGGMDVPETDYSKDAVSNFTLRYGLLPDERRTSAPMLWINYRSNGIDQLVEMASKKIKKIDPDIYLSAAVAPDGPPSKWQRNYLQNWPLWLEHGYVDFVIPMTYSPNPANVAGWFSSAVKKAPPTSQVFAGVSGFNLYNRLSLNNQVSQLGRTSGSLGSFFFAYDHFDLQSLKVLRAGVFSQDAAPAHRLFLEDWDALLTHLTKKLSKAKNTLSLDAFRILEKEYNELTLKKDSITSLRVYLSSLNQVRYLLSLVLQPAYASASLDLTGDLQMLERWLLAFGRKGILQNEVIEEIENCLIRLEELAPSTIFSTIPQYLYESRIFDISFHSEVNKLISAQALDPVYKSNLNLKTVLEKLAFTTLLLQGGEM